MRMNSPMVYGWCDEPEPEIAPFVCTVLVLSDGFSDVISISGGKDIKIDWGDGSVVEYGDVDDRITHSYATASTYTVKIWGTADLLQPSSWTLAIVEWGDQPKACIAPLDQSGPLESVPPYLPEYITSLARMFYWKISFNDPNVRQWDTSRITDMSSTFAWASGFKQTLDDVWDTSKVESFDYMFQRAGSYPGSINGFDFSSATSAVGMLNQATYNQPIDIYLPVCEDISSFLRVLEYGGQFNSEIKIDGPNVKKASYMFAGQTRFNKSVADIKLPVCEDFSYFLNGCTAFNQSLNGLDTSANKNFSYFVSASKASDIMAYNQPVDELDVSKGENFSYMFGSSSITLGYKHRFAQDTSMFDMRNATNVSYMFANCSNGAYSLASWCVPNVETNTGFANNVANFTSDKFPVWGTCPEDEE